MASATKNQNTSTYGSTSLNIVHIVHGNLTKKPIFYSVTAIYNLSSSIIFQNMYLMIENIIRNIESFKKKYVSLFLFKFKLSIYFLRKLIIYIKCDV